MAPPTYVVVSLPTSIVRTNDKEEALEALQAAIPSDVGQVQHFNIPAFKIGTLDALVQQADDLAKLSQACEGVVAKVGDALRTIMDGDEEKLAQQKTINDSTWYWGT
jgi:V-type H+-transporting ATPase subunit C